MPVDSVAFDINDQTIAYCVAHASRQYMVPPEALLAIMMQENGRPGMKKRNTNGSLDLGVMQINTVWLQDKSPLKYYIDENQIAYDTCANIHVATWILAKHYGSSRDIWRAIGMYHSPGNLGFATSYIQNVNSRLPKARRIISQNPYYGYYLNAFFIPNY
jgi:soluble lytic murein transglycosylase-like protein